MFIVMNRRADFYNVIVFKARIEVAFSYGKHNLETLKLNNLPILSKDIFDATKLRISLIKRFKGHKSAVFFFY